MVWVMTLSSMLLNFEVSLQLGVNFIFVFLICCLNLVVIFYRKEKTTGW